MSRILVIGGTHHNSLGVIRSLGERGYKVEFINFQAKGKCDYVASSRYIYKYIALETIEDLFPYLIERNTAEEREIIISCADIVTEYLNKYLNKLTKQYIIPGVPVQGKMVQLMDKTTMISMAEKRGIYAPTVWSLPAEKQNVTFPCITKCYVSSHGGKSDIVVINSKKELDTFITNNTGELFAQAFINKKEEIQFIGCSLNSGKEVIIPGMSKIIRSQPNTNTGFLEYGPLDPFYNDVVERAKLYIQDCEYSGLFSFEIIRGFDDKVWFLEINFRNDGNAWCVTKGGVNLPVIWVKFCLGEDYCSEIKKTKHLFMMPEFQDFKLVLQRKVGIFQWLKDLRKTNYFMEYDKRDSKPFWYYIKSKLLWQ